jgi:hypothetical protein
MDAWLCCKADCVRVSGPGGAPVELDVALGKEDCG